MTVVAVYGLGKLGAPLASVIAHAGYEVRGVDSDPNRITRLKQEQAVHRSAHTIGLFDEPLVSFDNDNLSFHVKAQESEISFIVVPTPSTTEGDFDARFVSAAINDIVTENSTTAHHMVVIVSTVSPGTCDALLTLLPQNYTLIYNPTFIALGSVVADLIHPPQLLWGSEQINDRHLDPLRTIWQNVFYNHGVGSTDWPPTHDGSFVEIELLKLSVNCALATKISLANSLGHLFDAYGVDPAAVEHLGHDERLGKGYWTPGSPITGPCLPRDNKAIQHAAHKKNVRMWLSEATDDIDYEVRERILRQACVINDGAMPDTIGVLGMSYKYGLPVTDGSMYEWLQLNAPSSAKVLGFDQDIHDCDPLDEVLGADVVVVAHKELEHLTTNLEKVIRVWP